MTNKYVPPWQALRERWGLDDFDESFASLMWRLAGPQPAPSLVSAVGALGRGLAQGQVCIDLAQAAGWLGVETDAESMPPVPPLAQWRTELLATAVVGEPGIRCPLILDAQNRLYLYRYWHYEQELAQGMLTRAQALLTPPARLQSTLRELFPSGPGMDEARLAAATAVLKRLCIVSGGPGTGKTFTAMRILALLLRLAGATPPRIALAAPTGKAAVRLQMALPAVLQGLPDALRPQLDALAQQAGTLHRLLGARPDGGFRHGPEQPLPFDILLVDEASMIDLALMWRLHRAMTTGARLILVGDRDQLASVEPGAVFHTLCQPSASRSTPLLECLQGLDVGRFLSARARTHAKAPAPLGDCTVSLRHNFRFSADSGIAALASAVRRGDPEQALAILAVPSAELDFHALAEDASGLPETCPARELAALYVPTDTTDPTVALACLSRFRILAVQREGPWGVSSLNARVRKRLDVGNEDWYCGRQVLVLQNRPEMNLYNGDLGIVLPRDGEVQVVFPAVNPFLRELSPYRLPPHEDAYAMTIHKSQGSEFDRVLLVLPPRPDHPLLSRRLLYTALTRARRRVDLWATPAAVRAAVSRDELRTSGLADSLSTQVEEEGTSA